MKVAFRAAPTFRIDGVERLTVTKSRAAGGRDSGTEKKVAGICLVGTIPRINGRIPRTACDEYCYSNPESILTSLITAITRFNIVIFHGGDCTENGRLWASLVLENLKKIKTRQR